jgi:hypothetical protein
LGCLRLRLQTAIISQRGPLAGTVFDPDALADTDAAPLGAGDGNLAQFTWTA